MTILIAGLLVFLGAHAFVRLRGPRDALAARLGAGPYRGLFSLVSLAGFALIVWGFALYRAEGAHILWEPPAALKMLAVVLTLPVFPLLIAAHAPGAIQSRARHPMLAAVKFWALAHLLANGDSGSLILAGGFLAWAVWARVGQPKTEAAPAPWGTGDWIAVLGGLAAWAATIMWLHRLLIGVPAM